MIRYFLVIVAWLWTAYECDTIGIDIFDMILLKSQTGGLFVWVLSFVLTYLTIIWMPNYLLTRAICGIFMLIPAEAFKLTRPLMPESGFAPIQLLVGFIYILAIIGMYGMFYPWKIKALIAKVCKK